MRFLSRAFQSWVLVNFAALTFCLHHGSVDWGQDNSTLLGRAYAGTFDLVVWLIIYVIPAHLIALGVAFVLVFKAGRWKRFAAIICTAMLWCAGLSYHVYRANRETPEARTAREEEENYEAKMRAAMEPGYRRPPDPPVRYTKEAIEKLHRQFEEAVRAASVSKPLPSPTGPSAPETSP